MKKSKCFFITIGVAIVLLIIAVLNFSNFTKWYNKQAKFIDLAVNWNLHIPVADKVLYQQDGAPGRDQQHYYVLKYNDKEKIKKFNSLDWVYKESPDIPRQWKEYVEKYNIPEKYVPSYDKPLNYYLIKHDDNSKIFMFYDLEDNILYVYEAWQ